MYVSPQIEELLEIPVEQWVGTYTVWLERIHPDDRDRADWEYRAMLDGGDNVRPRVPRCPPGRLGAVDARPGPPDDGAGGLAGYIQGVIFDVTDRHRAGGGDRAAGRRQRVLAELGLRALAGVDRDELMADAAEAAVEMLEMWGGGVLELQGDGLSDGRSRGARGARDRRAGGPGPRPRRVHAVDRRAVISNELETEARFRCSARRGRGDAGVLSVKIAGSPGPYGALRCTARRPPVRGRRGDYLQSVANMLAAAVERDRAQAALAASEASRQHVLAELLRSADAERARIATELHDDTIQVMTAALFALDRQDAPAAVATTPAAADAARDVRSTLADAVERTRRLTFELRPPLLQHGGSRRRFRSCWRRLSRRPGCRAGRSVGRHSGEVESLCYRTVQELVGTRVGTRGPPACASRWPTRTARWWPRCRTTASGSRSGARSIAA